MLKNVCCPDRDVVNKLISTVDKLYMKPQLEDKANFGMLLIVTTKHVHVPELAFLDRSISYGTLNEAINKYVKIFESLFRLSILKFLLQWAGLL